MPGNRAELLGAAIVVAVAAVFLYFSFQIHVPVTGDPLGPRWVPAVLSSALLLFGLIQAVIALNEAPNEDIELAIGESHQPKSGMNVIVIASAITLLYASALLYIGYALATALFAVTLYYLYGKNSLPRTLLAGVGMAACFYILFVVGLQTSLPSGYIWGGM